MPKFAIYNEAEWLKDVEADDVASACKLDPKATRAELISEVERPGKGV